MSELADEELFLRWRRGEQESLRELMRRYERSLYVFFVRFVSDRGAAEDLFQETFLRLYLKRADFKEGYAFRPWLYAVATNLARDHLRRVRVRSHVAPEANFLGPDEEAALIEHIAAKNPSPLEALSRAEMARMVRECFARLSDEARETLLLFYYQGLKYEEIAKELEIPIGTVKSRLHSAIVKLLETLSEKM